MAAKKKSAATKPAPRSNKKRKQAEAVPETPSIPLPETRDASRPPR
jgi:hypothetical protein